MKFDFDADKLLKLYYIYVAVVMSGLTIAAFSPPKSRLGKAAVVGGITSFAPVSMAVGLKAARDYDQ